MTPLARECMLVLVIELVFVSELTKSSREFSLQPKIKVTLEKFDSVQLPNHRYLSFIQDVTNRLVPSVDPIPGTV